MPTVLLWV